MNWVCYVGPFGWTGSGGVWEGLRGALGGGDLGGVWEGPTRKRMEIHSQLALQGVWGFGGGWLSGPWWDKWFRQRMFGDFGGCVRPLGRDKWFRQRIFGNFGGHVGPLSGDLGPCWFSQSFSVQHWLNISCQQSPK